jgi:hypothetical protein
LRDARPLTGPRQADGETMPDIEKPTKWATEFALKREFTNIETVFVD